MSKKLKVQIVEYVNGEARHMWFGAKECADFHRIHLNGLKQLIYTGNPLPSSRVGELVTFDIAPDSTVDLIESADGTYVFMDIAPDKPKAREV